MGFSMALNEKPRRRAGLDGPGEMALRLNCCLSVMDILTDCSSHVKHPTTPINSGNLVGETTRRLALNLDRGGQPLDTRRKSGSVNGTGKPAKVADSRVAPCSHNPLHDYLGVIPSCNRAEFTISHRG